MPITQRFVENTSLVLVRLSGACTGSEVAHTLRSLARDERLLPGASLLWDGRRLAHFSVVPGEVEAVVEAQEALEARTGPGQAAIVVARLEDDLVARLFVRLFDSAKREIRVFAELDEALDWLGLDDVEV